MNTATTTTSPPSAPVTFDAWLNQAWDDHVNAAERVAAAIEPQGAALVADEGQRVALARLAHHVLGEHLARWQDARAVVQRLTRDLGAAASIDTAQALDASLALASGAHDDDVRASATLPQRVRITAMAAALLAPHDAARAGRLLRDAVSDADAAAFDDQDPAVRSLAVSANNLAATLEELPSRSDDERELMLLAARTARRYWARAGTWLEVERAEYRLAMSSLKAGAIASAREHAQECLEIVRAQPDAPALEHFFGWEALAQVERAAGNAAGHAHAVAQMRDHFARLDAGDVAWCRTSLDAAADSPAA